MKAQVDTIQGKFVLCIILIMTSASIHEIITDISFPNDFVFGIIINQDDFIIFNECSSFATESIKYSDILSVCCFTSQSQFVISHCHTLLLH